MMITAASIIFLLAFVALGARPYRVALPLPPCEEVAPMRPTIFAGNVAQDDKLTPSGITLGSNRIVYVPSGSGGIGTGPISYMTHEELNEYILQHERFPEGVCVVDKRRVR